MRDQQRGSALVAAIFLIVVVAVLGTFAVRISVGQQATVNAALLGERARAAADLGVQWGAYRALNASCAPSTTITLSQAALRGFRVNVVCKTTAHTDGATAMNMYSIVAFAEYSTYGTPDYVYRKMSASFTDAN